MENLDPSRAGARARARTRTRRGDALSFSSVSNKKDMRKLARRRIRQATRQALHHDTAARLIRPYRWSQRPEQPHA